MILTTEEKALIKKHREEQDLNKPTKIGYLKEDLYQFTDEMTPYPTDYHTYTKDETNNLIQVFSKSFTVCLKKNSILDCYEDNGIESWYDRVDGSVDGASTPWATKHLTKIKSVRRKGVSYS